MVEGRPRPGEPEHGGLRGSGGDLTADGTTTDKFSTDEFSTDDAAAKAALARARRAAEAKGARPGSPPRRRLRGVTPSTYSSAGSDDRDPALLGDQFDRLLGERGWRVDVAAGAVMARWADIVGADVARHCIPVGFAEAVLTIRADSTAWATQLRYMTSTVLARIDEEIGVGHVQRLRVTGPSAPSWRRGPRRAADGVGPRDTYG